MRNWADRDPVAAARLTQARADLATMGEELSVPVENLLTPDFLRRVLWTPPKTGTGDTEAGVREALSALGARPWQVDLTAPLIAAAIEDNR